MTRSAVAYPSFARTVSSIYPHDPTMAKPYLEAGCPFGNSALGMAIWHTYQQKTTVN